LGRKSVEGSHVRGARLTVSLQIQEASLRRFLEKNGDLARGNGFLARFLLCWPETTQGWRLHSDAGAMPALGRFNHRIRAILDQPINWELGRTLKPTMLDFTPEAKDAWVKAHDAIEVQLRTGGLLSDLKDVASKAADNIARIAGLLQLLERGVSGIEPWAMKAAMEIVGWHLMESRRFFGELALPTELSLAARLDGWLIDRCKRGKTDSIARSDVQQFGPGCLREKKNLDIAAGELIEHRRIRYAVVEKRKHFQVHPSLIGGAS
jgi:putative DNA primase/helicase